jgi:hypothetical protein
MIGTFLSPAGITAPRRRSTGCDRCPGYRPSLPRGRSSRSNGSSRSRAPAAEASRVASDLRVQACRHPYLSGPPEACRVVRGIPSVSQDDGLPRIATGSAPTSPSFRARMALTIVAACLLAEPPEAARCLVGFDGFVTAAVPIATGWSD